VGIRIPYGSCIPHHTAQRARIATPMYHRLAMTEVVDTLPHLSNLPRHSEEGKAQRGNPHPHKKQPPNSQEFGGRFCS